MELCRVWTGVCVVPVPNYQERHVGSCLDVVTMKRYREEVGFRTVLSPVTFQDSLTVYNKDSSTRQRRYRSLTRYEPRSKPRIFHESIVIYPKRTEMTFVAAVDYHIDECRKWFQTTMEFKAKTYTTTKIQNVNSNCNSSSSQKNGGPDNNNSYNNHTTNNNDNNELLDNNNSPCDFPYSSSPGLKLKSDERKRLDDHGISNGGGPGASLIYLPRFEKEDHFKPCNFNLVKSASDNVLILEDGSSEDEVDV